MKGRLKRRWVGNIKHILTEKGLSGEETEKPGCFDATNPIYLHHIKVRENNDDDVNCSRFASVIHISCTMLFSNN